MNSKKYKQSFIVMAIILLMGIHSQSHAVSYILNLPLEGSNCGTVSGITVCWESSTTNAEGKLTFLSDIFSTVPSLGTAYTTEDFSNYGDIWGPGAVLFATGNTKIESTGVFYNSGNIKGITELQTTAGSFFNTGSVEADIVINRGSFFAYAGGHIVANQDFFNYGVFSNGGEITADRLFNTSVFSSSGSINSNEIVNNLGATFLNSGTLNNSGTIINLAGAKLINDDTLKTATLDNRAFGTIENNGDLDATRIVNNIYGIFKNSGELTYGTINNFGDFSTSGEIRDGKVFNNDGTLTINDGGSFINAYDAQFFNNNGGNVIVEFGGKLINESFGGNFVNKNGGMLTVNGGGELTNEYFAEILNESGGVITNYGFFNNHGFFINELGAETTNNSFFTIYGLNSGKGEGGGKLINEGKFINKGWLTIARDNVFEYALYNTGTFENEILMVNGSAINNSGDGIINNSGEIVNSRFFHNEGVLNSSGEIKNNDYFLNEGTLESTGEFYNKGTLESNYGGAITNSGDFSNVGTIYSSKFTNNGTLTNDNVITNSGDLLNTGDLINNGTLTNNRNLANSGNINNTKTINGRGTYTQTAGETINDGTLSQSAVYINGGTLSGSGSIFGDVYIGSNGSLNPGTSPGVMSINGDLTFTDGLFEIELGGLLPGEYDQVTVSGIARLSGELHVSFWDLTDDQIDNPFTPDLGDTFDILSAESIEGQFDFTTLALLGAGFVWQLEYLFNEIGSTDIVRLTVIDSNNGAAPVPEPTTMLLFGLGLLGLAGINRKKESIV